MLRAETRRCTEKKKSFLHQGNQLECSVPTGRSRLLGRVPPCSGLPNDGLGDGRAGSLATSSEQAAGGSSREVIHALASGSSLGRAVAPSENSLRCRESLASCRIHVYVGFCQRALLGPSSHCSHCRLKSFEKRFLLCLPLVPGGAPASGGTAGLSRLGCRCRR